MKLPRRGQNDISALAEELKTNSEFQAYVRNVAESIVTPETSTSPPVSGYTSPRKRSLPDDAMVDSQIKVDSSLAGRTVTSRYDL